MYNLHPTSSIEESYQLGLLPQRNDKNSFYQDSSCRSNLSDFSLSSENRRILKKTESFSFTVLPLSQFSYTPDVQKQIYSWIKTLKWDFPVSSIKNVFTNHIFNHLYIWQQNNNTVAYSVCYNSANFSHIAYVFYDPDLTKSSLPIRLTLQTVIDSHQQNLKFCYLGRFDPQKGIGFYKRTLPGFEYFQNGVWLKYNS